jgi:hypothetical protein
LDCHACTKSYKGIRSLQTAVANQALRFEPPANFERRLRSALHGEAEPEQRSPLIPWRWLTAGAALLAAVVVIWALTAIFSRPAAGDVLAQEIVSSHVRSLMAAHLTDAVFRSTHSQAMVRRQT